MCEDCGYVGIDADHGGEPVEVESWDDALRRFYAEHGADADPRVEVARDDVTERRRDGESWDDALRRFYAQHEDGSSAAGESDEADESTAHAADDERPSDDRTGDTDEKRATTADDGADDEPADSDESTGTPASQSSADGS
ncbi:hypothetical protein ACFQJD_14045 [Haloplanus sp. GCM10025708]|uniref:hypothetical protein n=1 Tax=Haloplanus sp. GCM10025708 TaxID=3252679 RepID=UPI003618B73C